MLLFSRRIRDVTNNLKIMRREVVLDLRLRQPGFAVNAETGLQPLLLGYRVKQVPSLGSTARRAWEHLPFASCVLAAAIGRCSWDCGLIMPLASDRTATLAGSAARARTSRRMSRLGDTWANTDRERAATNLAAAGRLCSSSARATWSHWMAQSLGDEVFSLAIATGHSLEHPAATADPALGDFVEPEGPVHAEEFKRYLAHDDPPASPARVVRAVLLSDTSPPLYYLLLYGWTLVFGTSDVALRLFSTAWSLACLPFLAGIARRTGGRGAGFARLHSLRALAFGRVLLDGGAHGLAPVVLRACHGLGFPCLAPTRREHRSLRGVGGGLGSWISDPLLFPLSVDGYGVLPRNAPWNACEKTLDSIHFRGGSGDRTLVREGAGVPRSLADHPGLAEVRAERFDRLEVTRDQVFRVFLWGWRVPGSLGKARKG